MRRMSSFQPIKCSAPSPPRLVANPDIAGVGVRTKLIGLNPNGVQVLIGFAASAYATLLLCTAYYLVNTRRLKNRVDLMCIDNVSDVFGRKGRTKSKKYRIALQDTVLAFSDLQMLTGFAILISGYTQLHTGLAVYHWQIVVDLAWFSSITHLTTLTCLRHYFREHPTPRIVRLMCMGIIAVMLTCALASTGYWNNWNSSLVNGYPAQCFYHPDSGLTKQGYNGVYIALAAALLGISYIIRIPQLFESTSKRIKHHVRTRPSKFLKRLVVDARKRAATAPKRFARLFWTLVSLSVFSIYCLLKGAVELYGSLLWEITWLFFALAWGTIRVLQDRNGDAPDSDTVSSSVSQEDNVWGFGQVIAVSLLILPCMAFYNAVSEANHQPEEPAEYDNEQYGNVRDKSESDNGSTHERPDNSMSLLPDSSIEPINPFNHDLYQYSWFRAMIVLLYGHSLEMAAQVLYVFPYSQSTADPSKIDFGYQALGFLMYFALNLGLVCTFCGVCVLFQNMDSISAAPEMNRQRALMRRKWVQFILWNAPVAVLLAGSAVFGYFLFDAGDSNPLYNVVNPWANER